MSSLLQNVSIIHGWPCDINVSFVRPCSVYSQQHVERSRHAACGRFQKTEATGGISNITLRKPGLMSGSWGL